MSTFLARFWDKGLVIPLPIPFLSTYLPGLKLRLCRFDANPDDGRIGLTVQVEWVKPAP